MIKTINIMSPNRLPSSIFFFYIFLFCSSIVYCSTRDILKHGEWIIDNGSTLVSAGGMFELGFFTPMKSLSPKRFVGIWYHTWGQQVVWVANRDDPILDGSIGVFGIAEDGKLKVWDNSSFGREYWSPGLEKSSSTNQIVRLMDSGNLVLSEDVQSAMILWESFKYPTDTFLSGMKMDEKTNLVSWNGSSDPGTGQFTFKQDEDESGEGSYAIKEKVGFHWKSRSTGKFLKSEKMPIYIANLLSNFSTITSSRYFRNTTTQLFQNYGNARLVMHYSGELRYLVWDIKDQNWYLAWWEPENQCSIYKACGKFGSCNINNWFTCKCLPGSKPTDPEKWNSRNFFDGCTRNSTSCDMSWTFLNLHRMNVRDPDTNNEVKDKEECKKLCVEECRCQAYSYEGTKNSTQRGDTSTSANLCWIWMEDLSDLQEDYEIGRDISVRVAKSDIGSSARNCEPCGTNVIPYPLSTSPNCGDPMYFSFHCNTFTGQLSFKAPSSLYQVDSIYPSEQKFVIQVMINYTDNRKTRNIGDPGLNISLPFSVNYWLPDPGNLSPEITAVEISWVPPPEPTCKSTADCKDWPRSTCNAAKDGKKRCHCAPNFRWDVSNLNCTQEQEEGEIIQRKGAKQQKTAIEPRDKRSTFIDSQCDQNRADVRVPPRAWSPQLEVDGAPIPWDSSVREYRRGQAAYVAEALEQPLLLPKDMEAVRNLKQQDLFLCLKRDLAMITQEVFVAEEWVKEARGEAKNEILLRREAEKATGAAKAESQELQAKLVVVERERKSAEAGLKSAEAQAEDQRKLLYKTELELATSRQLVLDLKAELQRAKEAAQLAKEAFEAERQASYQLGVEETEAKLTEELAEACREFCDATWAEALNVAGVPTDSALRGSEKVYYHPNIHEIPDDSFLDAPGAAAAKEAEAKEAVSEVPSATVVKGDETTAKGEPSQTDNPPAPEA